MEPVLFLIALTAVVAAALVAIALMAFDMGCGEPSDGADARGRRHRPR